MGVVDRAAAAARREDRRAENFGEAFRRGVSPAVIHAAADPEHGALGLREHFRRTVEILRSSLGHTSLGVIAGIGIGHGILLIDRNLNDLRSRAARTDFLKRAL